MSGLFNDNCCERSDGSGCQEFFDDKSLSFAWMQYILFVGST